MANVSLKLLNDKKIIQAFKVAPKQMTQAVEMTVRQVGGEAVGKVKEHITYGTDMWKSPIKTGTMRRMISIVETRPLKVTIAPNLSVTPYAVYVHEGTRYMRKRPFFDITKRHEEKYLIGFFKKTIEKFAKELTKKI